MTNPDPFDSLAKLRAAIQRVVEPLGLSVHDWVLFPDGKTTNVIFMVDPSAFLPSAERETLKQFNEMMDEQQVHDLQARSKARIQEMIDGMTGGILDDPPGE